MGWNSISLITDSKVQQQSFLSLELKHGIIIFFSLTVHNGRFQMSCEETLGHVGSDPVKSPSQGVYSVFTLMLPGGCLLRGMNSHFVLNFLSASTLK